MDEELWKLPRFRKFMAIATPVSLVAAWVTAVVCDRKVKEFSESIFPFGVDLIRKYHGLDEEDLFAIDNERKTLAAQKKFYNVTIRSSDQSVVTLHHISGETSTKSLVNDHGGDAQVILSIDCEDKEGDEEEEDRIDMYENRSNYVASLSESSLMSSSWNKNLAFAIPNSSNSSKATHSKFYGDRLYWLPWGGSLADILEFQFQSFLLYHLSGLNRYLDFGNRHLNFTPKVDIHTLQKYFEAPVVSKTGPISRSERQEALEMVEYLKQQIDALKQEKRAGSREIDSIDAEIAAIQAEITRISRSKINYFYFF